MRLLIIGSDEVWSLEKSYSKYLAEEGIEVRTCPVQSIFYSYYNRSILNKVLFKSGLSGIYRRIEIIVREMIENWKPDVLWVFKGMEISPELLKWIRKSGILLVNYNPDNPFIFTGSGSGNKNVARSIACYDLHFTYDRDISRQLKEEFNVRTALLPFGFDLSEELFQQCRDATEIVKACFLGNPDSKRAQFLNSLAEEGIDLDVYGHGWNRFLKHPNIKTYPPVYGAEFWKTLRRYRVQLNLMRIHNLHSHNMRSFEIPGVGGIGLYPDTFDHRTYFTPGQHVFLFKNEQECASAINDLLKLPADSIDIIRQQARLHSISKGYTYHDKAKQALSQIKLLLG
jgi:spore maturation protein CgeB